MPKLCDWARSCRMNILIVLTIIVVVTVSFGVIVFAASTTITGIRFCLIYLYCEIIHIMCL